MKNLDVRYFAPLVRSLSELQDAIAEAGRKSEFTGKVYSIFQAPTLALIVTDEPAKTLPLVATVEYVEEEPVSVANEPGVMPPPDEIDLGDFA